MAGTRARARSRGGYPGDRLAALGEGATRGSGPPTSHTRTTTPYEGGAWGFLRQEAGKRSWAPRRFGDRERRRAPPAGPRRRLPLASCSMTADRSALGKRSRCGVDGPRSSARVTSGGRTGTTVERFDRLPPYVPAEVPVSRPKSSLDIFGEWVPGESGRASPLFRSQGESGSGA